MFNLPNLSSKALLLSGASLAAILITAPAQATTLGGMTGRTSAQINATLNPATNRPGGPLSPGAAAQKTSQSTQDFSTALARIQGQLSAQASARSVAATGPNNLGMDPNHPGQQLPDVPNGLGTGGLAPSANVSVDPSLWQNADAPTQAAANGQTTVTVHQNAQKAILTWDSFNVGKNTTVHFDQTGGAQSDGTNNWIALNRIVDPSDRPSQILGNITAEGSVYLINNNGIIFGGSSQINVHSLIASSLSFLGENINGLTPGSAAYDNAVAASNATFLTTGIATPEATNNGSGSSGGNLVLGLGGPITVATAQDYQAPGDIVVQAGANITTHENGSQGDGGYVLLAAPSVTNAGAINTADGQAILAAGVGISFYPTPGNNSQILNANVTGQVLAGSGASQTDITPVGTLTNTGLMQASRGYITLLGADVAQNGVVEVTTGVSYPGGITIMAADETFNTDTTAPGSLPPFRRAGELSFGPGSLTTDLPEEDGETATSAPTSIFTPGKIALTGGSVWFQGSALLEMPGANITVAALAPGAGGISGEQQPKGDTTVQGRIYVDNGATIDVAGLSNVELPVSSTLVTIPLIGQNEIADEPNQKGLLGLTDIVIDSGLAGTTPDGLSWVGTPVLNASGYVQLVSRSIDQLLTNGGSLTLSGQQVLTATGSSLNLDGGYTHYLGGEIVTTRLLDSNGLVADVGHANPNDVYVGVAGVNALTHDRWGITDEYTNSLIAGGYYQPDYIQGGNAGTLTVFGYQAVVLDGSISAQAIPGLKQVAAGQAPSNATPGGSYLPVGGTFDLGGASALAFPAGLDPVTGETGSVIVQNAAPQLTSFDPNFSIDTVFNTAALNALGPNDANNILQWRTVPTDVIDNGGFANVSVTNNLTVATGSPALVVAQGSTLSVQPGGSISFTSSGGDISILGSLVAPSGNISAQLGRGGGNIVVGPNATINTAGQWINDADLLRAPGADTFVDGGEISLIVTSSYGGSFVAPINNTGSVLLAPGSVLDVSSGGVMLAGGILSKDGIPEGEGGSVTLETYSGVFPSVPTIQPTTGGIELDGTIESAGFSGGGTLTLQALGIQIGGDPSQAPAWDLYLPEDFFEKQGFGSYQLNAMYDAVVAPGTDLRLTQQNLLPNLTALAAAPTGSDLNAKSLTTLGTLDAYHRQPTNLNIVAGGYAGTSPNAGFAYPQYDGVTGAVTLGAGAVIDADAGASIGLASPFQVTVLGSIVAHGGSILLSANTINYGFEVPDQLNFGSGFTTPSQSVWLGADAVLDVSGVALMDPFASPVLVGGNLVVPTTGKVLDGGSVILSDDTGRVVAEKGSLIDVSGSSASFDLPEAGGRLVGQNYAAQSVWSNAGSIILGAGDGLYFDGTLKGQPGAADAQGATLTILPELTAPVSTLLASGVATSSGAAGLIIEQSGFLVPDGQVVGQDFPTLNAGMLEFAADRLTGSGISSIILGGGNVNGNEYAPFVAPVPIAFAGNVNLTANTSITLIAPQIMALPAGATMIPAATAGETDLATTVSMSAPYVSIQGPTYSSGAPPQLLTVAASGDATLSVNASFIDLENQFALFNFGQANFTSQGDLRLSSTNASSDNTSLSPGILYTPGNVTLQAADIYPASGSPFILDAVGPQPTTVTILGNGVSNTPLSAGGSLLIDADTIVQSGTIQAPFGSIVLGVSDVNDTSVQVEFGNLPLTQTQSVSIAAGSLTSVSADGTTLPYGTTIDGTDWYYNDVPGTTSKTLSSPPAKTISLNGVNITLNAKGTIDISGGGELQAMEWVPGTGGTRDVLSQYNVSYASNSAGVAAPLYSDARNVYAIVPGYSAPVAAYDPVFAKNTMPGSGGAAPQSVALGVGQAGTGDAVGKAVYLSGVPGLPAGVYTLLPAKYATLPGAFRVVQNTSASNVIPGQTATLADGTNLVTGYFEDALNGSRSATPSQFEVQSTATWGKYSQYNLTSADTFFAAQAISAGSVIPALPMDAGQLVLAATSSLNLGATLNTAPAKGGAPAEVDIASQDIQIMGSGEAALAGYLQLSANDLDALNAGSLLIGGTRTRTSTGVTILADANSVVVSNDAGNPLSGSEIILVTKTDTTGTDPNAGNGLRLDPGSVVTATGTLPAGAALPITIGSSTMSGDGSLVRVSQGTQVAITRVNVPTSPLGSLTVDAGATVNGGAALTLDSSGALNFDPAATFSGTEIAVDAPSITITGNADNTGLTGFVVGPNSLAQFANAKQVDLRSYGDLAFNGNLNLTFGENIDFSAGNFTGDGGTVTISAPTVAFTNDLNAPSNNTPVPGQGSLTVDATEIDLGSGSKSLKGFSSVAMTATGGIVGQDTGSFDMGSANVTMAAPLYVADTGSDTSLTTTGSLALNSNSGTALTITPVGGGISFIAGAITDNSATIEAPAGNVSLEATSGDLNVASGALISSVGVSKLFYDVTEYAPAGAITLTADQGMVNIASGSTLDFSGANGGGAAGSLSLSAPVQTVVLNGTIKGNAADGYLGGSFSLNTGGAVDLDNLSTELAASGVNDAIAVQTNAGNLVLSAANTITAHVVSLTADGGTGGEGATDGNITINGTIDASGNAGGEIDLYGKSSVDLEGSLIARGTSSTERGGTVNIGTVSNVVAGSASLDPTYGYEEVSAANSGSITLGANALIDVSGGTKGGLSGGTVSFRAPLLDAADNHDVNVFLPASFNPGKGIIGSRATTLEAYAVWSTDDPVTNGAAQHFDGIVDPAGWYNATGTLLAGAFTDAAGNTVATWNGTTLTNSDSTTNDLSYYLTNDYFAPTALNTDASRTAHETFYGYVNGDATTAAPGTLMGFVENFPISSATTAKFANIQNFAVTPGIELDNPDPAINDGSISILTNWNLGAGTSPTNLAYRFNGQAPIITFKAENDVKVDASLTDGFFQILDPTQPGQTTTVVYVNVTAPTPSSYHNAYRAFAYNYDYFPGYPAYGGKYSAAFPSASAKTAFPGILAGPTSAASFGANPDAQELAQYYGLYQEYLNDIYARFTPVDGPFIHNVMNSGENNHAFGRPAVAGQPTFTISAPTAAQALADPAAWLLYVSQYETYAEQLATWIGHNPFALYQVVPLEAPPAVLTSLIINSSQATTVVSGDPRIMDNSPSPISNSTHAIPLETASLNGGNSSSYRIVSGSDITSADPLSLSAGSNFTSGEGSISLSGHFAWADSNGETLYQPTMIRTGTGSIDIAAATDVVFQDQIAPAVVYTAGTPAVGAPTSSNSGILHGSVAAGGPEAFDILYTNAVNPTAAGDITINAQDNIKGSESVAGAAGTNSSGPGIGASQFWWEWMQTGNIVNGAGQMTQSSINFGGFDQGIMSVGGNVSISAGADISDLSVSLPTTWYLSNNNTSVNTVGGGNLTVSAGGNIYSGDYFVAKGTGTITAGGLIGSNGLTYLGQFNQSTEVSTILAMQDATMNVSARHGADIGAVVDPSYIQGAVLISDFKVHADAQGYSPTSSVNVTTVTGDISFNTLTSLSLLSAALPSGNDDRSILPASVNLAAFSGGLNVEGGGTLYPSSVGELSLVADQSIIFTQGGPNSSQLLSMSDAPASSLPSPLNAIPDTLAGTVPLPADTPTPLHADDTQPVRIYSLNGNIVDGSIEASGLNAGDYANTLSISVDKPAQIYAANDIINLTFLGQNFRDDDVTRIVAGRDIWDDPNLRLLVGASPPALRLGGVGTFDVEAGRNIGPLSPSLSNSPTGILAIGNAENPFLPHQSADVQVLYGVANGIDNADFTAAFVNPAITSPDVQQALVAFMEQYVGGHVVDTGLKKDKVAITLSLDQAWTEFQQLPEVVQQQFNQKALFITLTNVDIDYNDPTSPFFHQYARGYQAINTLFPASLGYTANSLEGGKQGANTLVSTGNLDIRNTTIQTQQGGTGWTDPSVPTEAGTDVQKLTNGTSLTQGGNVTIMGPGGQALIGSDVAPPAVGGLAAGQGVLTLETGDVDVFSDQSVLLAQSRIFTEQGGGMTIWSSNGDINAGKGAKTIADVPAPIFVCNDDFYCTRDARGEVSGAGIATLQTIPGASSSNVYLIAPRGTVDAGAAGIRVSGDLFVAALAVANANNIQVQGKSVGLPPQPVTNLTLATASTAATEAALITNGLKSQQPQTAVDVEVTGYGGESASEPARCLPSSLNDCR